ncbi:MAG TPA: energy transducer TonB [Thermoanaerobaculia bacterium]|nr:energy transducer TonB [Thermoanaerobaculia bacterium]
MRPRFLLLLFLATTAVAETNPYSVASLVHEKEAAAPLREALLDPDPLVRATATRVTTVRELTELLPQLRERLDVESDATAAREVIRAIGLLGTEDDVALAVKASSRFPAGMDDTLAVAVARRGVANALPIYLATLKETRMDNHAEFFRVGLWGQANLIAFAGSRLLGSGDARGWRGLLGALGDSHIAMNPGVMVASLGSPHEPIRSASLWCLIHGYAVDPSVLPPPLKESLSVARTEVSSNREDFARELLRRMLGAERKNEERWLTFLATEEADVLLKREVAALQYLTEEEYAIRYRRCEVQSYDCALPRKRTTRMTIASQTVAPPAFNLPELLPPGLADAIVSGARCRGTWIGVATASVDQAGRVKTLDLEPVSTSSACKRALETLLHLSLATNTSLQSGFNGPVLLAHADRASLCLDERPPENATLGMFRVGGEVQPPKVKKRMEPNFPDVARRSMGANRNVFVVLEAVISSTGCIRSLRVIEQSPFPELNGAALLAVSQWTFTPAYHDNKPVDVIFNLSINFKTSL